MDNYSLADLMSAIGCYGLKSDTNAAALLTYLGLNSSSSCDDIINKLWDLYQIDKNNSDLRNFFIYLLFENPAYFDKVNTNGSFVGTDKMIEFGLFDAVVGFDELKTMLTGLQVIVPSELKNLSTEIKTEAGM